jgi:hypothetical protein
MVELQQQSWLYFFVVMLTFIVRRRVQKKTPKLN